MYIRICSQYPVRLIWDTRTGDFPCTSSLRHFRMLLWWLIAHLLRENVGAADWLDAALMVLMKPWMKYVPGCLLRGHDDFANVAGDTRMESPSTGALLSGIFSCNCFSAPWKESCKQVVSPNLYGQIYCKCNILLKPFDTWLRYNLESSEKEK